jgi:hypothetical protein
MLTDDELKALLLTCLAKGPGAWGALADRLQERGRVPDRRAKRGQATDGRPRKGR